jgi:hypothetical protein
VDVGRLLQVDRREAEQLLGVVVRLVGRPAGAGAELAPVEVADHLAAEADAVVLVGGQVVGQAGGAGVHLGAAQLLLVGLLAGGHLHQRRPAQEHPGPPGDHDGVVRHARHVGAARGRAAEHQRDRGDAGPRQAREVPEYGAAGNENFRLSRQVGAARLD